jgi:O-acetyl-ADP-ribose deacetylase (regulator of RNase III)
VYGFPADRAARIAVRTVADHIAANSHLDRVIFACFGKASVDCHEAARLAVGI